MTIAELIAALQNLDDHNKVVWVNNGWGISDPMDISDIYDAEDRVWIG